MWKSNSIAAACPAASGTVRTCADPLVRRFLLGHRGSPSFNVYDHASVGSRTGRSAHRSRATSREKRVWWRVLSVWQQDMPNAYRIMYTLAATSWLRVRDA